MQPQMRLERERNVSPPARVQIFSALRANGRRGKLRPLAHSAHVQSGWSFVTPLNAFTFVLSRVLHSKLSKLTAVFQNFWKY